MKVIDVDFIMDGGTAVLNTNEGKLYLDRRLSSSEEGNLYNAYPTDEGSRLVNQKKEDLRIALQRFLLEDPDMMYAKAVKNVIHDLE